MVEGAKCTTPGHLGGFLLGMVRPQFPIGLLLFEQMIDDDQDAMSQGHNGFLVAHALVQSLVIGTEKATLTACSTDGGFHQGLEQPATAVAPLCAQPFVRADRCLW